MFILQSVRPAAVLISLQGTASYYSTAYFEISYLRIYGNGTDVVVSGSSDSSSGSSTSASSGSSSTSTSSSDSSAARPFAQLASFGAALVAGSVALIAIL